MTGDGSKVQCYKEQFFIGTWNFMLESSSSSQGISVKGGEASVKNNVASDSRYGTTCLSQASGLLLYFDKSIRSTVLHFQFTLTQIYCLIVALQTEFLLQRFSQNRVYLWLHWNSHAYVWAVNHISQFIFYLFKSCLPLTSWAHYLLKRLLAIVFLKIPNFYKL